MKLIKVIIKTVDKLLGREEGTSEKLITYVTDRAGHDMRYAIDATKIKNELGDLEIFGENIYAIHSIKYLERGISYEH